jgi:hypothetical protein
VDWRKVRALAPDLIILDKDENTKAIAESAPAPILPTHVESVADVEGELNRLAKILANAKLETLARRWKRIVLHSAPAVSLDSLPGITKWIRRPSHDVRQLLYLVWTQPWITVSRSTFIGSVLEKLGYGDLLVSFDLKYPRIRLEDFDQSRTLLLFATEPYPFHRDLPTATETGFPAALVDGEKFSWFGLRSLRFLEEQLEGS